jgi:hypothetical protein
MRCYLRQVAGEAGVAFFAHSNLVTNKSAGSKSKRRECRPKQDGDGSANSSFTTETADSFSAEYLAV